MGKKNKPSNERESLKKTATKSKEKRDRFRENRQRLIQELRARLEAKASLPTSDGTGENENALTVLDPSEGERRTPTITDLVGGFNGARAVSVSEETKEEEPVQAFLPRYQKNADTFKRQKLYTPGDKLTPQEFLAPMYKRWNLLLDRLNVFERRVEAINSNFKLNERVYKYMGEVKAIRHMVATTMKKIYDLDTAIPEENEIAWLIISKLESRVYQVEPIDLDLLDEEVRRIASSATLALNNEIRTENKGKRGRPPESRIMAERKRRELLDLEVKAVGELAHDVNTADRDRVELAQNLKRYRDATTPAERRAARQRIDSDDMINDILEEFIKEMWDDVVQEESRAAFESILKEAAEDAMAEEEATKKSPAEEIKEFAEKAKETTREEPTAVEETKKEDDDDDDDDDEFHDAEAPPAEAPKPKPEAKSEPKPEAKPEAEAEAVHGPPDSDPDPDPDDDDDDDDEDEDDDDEDDEDDEDEEEEDQNQDDDEDEDLQPEPAPYIDLDEFEARMQSQQAADSARHIDRLVEIGRDELYRADEDLGLLGEKLQAINRKIVRSNDRMTELRAKEAKLIAEVKSAKRLQRQTARELANAVDSDRALRELAATVAARDLMEAKRELEETKKEVNVEGQVQSDLEVNRADINQSIQNTQATRDAVRERVAGFVAELNAELNQATNAREGYRSLIANKRAEGHEIKAQVKHLTAEIDQAAKELEKFKTDRELIPDMIMERNNYKQILESVRAKKSELAILKQRLATNREEQQQLLTAKNAAEVLAQAAIRGALAVRAQPNPNDPNHGNPEDARQKLTEELEAIDEEIKRIQHTLDSYDGSPEDYERLTKKIEDLSADKTALSEGLGELDKTIDEIYNRQAHWYEPLLWDKIPEKDNSMYGTRIKTYNKLVRDIIALQRQLRTERDMKKLRQLHEMQSDADEQLSVLNTFHAHRQALRDRQKTASLKILHEAETSLRRDDGGAYVNFDWGRFYGLHFRIKELLEAPDEEQENPSWSKELNKLTTEYDELIETAKFSSPVTFSVDEKIAILKRREASLERARRQADMRGSQFTTNLETAYLSLKAELEIEGEVLTDELRQAAMDHVAEQQQDRIHDYEDATTRAKTRLSELLSEIMNDVSANGPLILEQAQMIFEKFQAMIAGANKSEIDKFNQALRDEQSLHLKAVLSQIRNLTYKNQGFQLQNVASSKAIVDCLMDPLSFAEGNKREMLLNTKLGIAWTETSRLVGLLQRQIDLRQKMLPIYEHINMVDEGIDGGQFDLIFTHLYPPSVIGMRLRILKLLRPDQRREYEQSPFVRAIRAINPDFDIATLNGDTFAETIKNLEGQVQKYMETTVEAAGFNLADIMASAEEIERNKALILAQINPNLDKAMEDDPSAKPSAKSSDFAFDLDSGAAPPDENGAILNPTFNPMTQGQLTRDAIDEAKRQQFMQLEKRHVMLSLKATPQPPYVPLHVTPSLFFFSKDDYSALQKMFESIRPLIPKNRIQNPGFEIDKILSQYGEIFGIQERITSGRDHPALIQQEAIELQQMVKAYSTYTSMTETGYNRGTDQSQASQPQQSQSQSQPQSGNSNSVGPSTDQTPISNPTSIGEETSDPLVKGTRSIFGGGFASMPNNNSNFWTGTSGF